MENNINPFDILSGKVVQNESGTFYFKDPGYNMQENGRPIQENLHRTDRPAVEHTNGVIEHYENGKRANSRINNGNPIQFPKGINKSVLCNGTEYTREEIDNINVNIGYDMFAEGVNILIQSGLSVRYNDPSTPSP